MSRVFQKLCDFSDSVNKASSLGQPIPLVRRAVYPTLERWLQVPATCLLVRGQRMVGKSFSLRHLLASLKRPYLWLKMDQMANSDWQTLIRDAQEAGAVESKTRLLSSVSKGQITNGFLNLLCEGVTIVFDEVQGADTRRLQAQLRSLIDNMDHESKIHRTKWSNAGNIVLLGSLPQMVDDLFTDHTAPLFQRVMARVTLLPFNTSEICSLLSHLKVLTPATLLTLTTLIGGVPARYDQLAQAGLLTPEAVGTPGWRQSVVKHFFYSEGQDLSVDADEYFRNFHGKKVAAILKGLRESAKQLKNDQIKAVEKRLEGLDHDEPYREVHDICYRRYEVVEPQFSLRPNDFQQRGKDTFGIYQFALPIPLMRVVYDIKQAGDAVTGVEDVNFCSPNWAKIMRELNQLEGQHFEELVRRAILDRWHLSKEWPLPLPEWDGVLPDPDYYPRTTHFLCWRLNADGTQAQCNENNSDSESEAEEEGTGAKATPRAATQKGRSDVEIDIIMSIPAAKRLFIVSCKRCSDAIRTTALVKHFRNLLFHMKDTKRGIVSEQLDLDFPFQRFEDKGWVVDFVHVYADGEAADCTMPADEVKGMEKYHKNHFVISLESLISGFAKTSSLELCERQFPKATTTHASPSGTVQSTVSGSSVLGA